MQYIAFILNLPWTFLGVIASLLSIPKQISVQSRPIAIIVKVRSFWWYVWLPGKTGVRAITNGHVIQLGPLEQKKDLEHELIHVEQAIREPLLHPIFYVFESLKHGYKANKYETEAYERAGNKYQIK